MDTMESFLYTRKLRRKST